MKSEIEARVNVNQMGLFYLNCTFGALKIPFHEFRTPRSRSRARGRDGFNPLKVTSEMAKTRFEIPNIIIPRKV